MDYTQHYNLKKPAYGEAVDVKDLNDNADITDAQLNTLAGLVAARLLKTDLTNQIINDATKVASAATVYSVNKKADDLNSDLAEINLKQFINISGDYENTVNRGGQVIVCGNMTIISMYFSVKNACVAGATIPFLASGGDTRMIPYGVCYLQACTTGGKAFYSEYSSSAFRIKSSEATAAGTSFIVSGSFINTVK